MRRVLSLGGGGIRALMAAKVLREFESTYQVKTSSCFDLLAGTSGGGLLALGLAFNASADTLYELFFERGNEVFCGSFLQKLSSFWSLNGPRYSSEGLKQVVRDLLGEHNFIEASVPVLTTAYEVRKLEPVIFRSWAKSDPLVKNLRAVDAAMATSAAPTYFKPHRVGNKCYIDGGIFVNSPALLALTEARLLWPSETDFVVVSLECGELTRAYDIEALEDWGLLHWARPIFHFIMDAQCDAAWMSVCEILPEDRALRFNPRLTNGNDDLDDATKENVAALTRDAIYEIMSSDAIRKIRRLVCESG